MGVAFVFDDGAEGNIRIESKAGDGIFEDGAIAYGDAGDIGIDNTGKSEDIVDAGVVIFGGFGILSDDEGGILAAGGNTLGDFDSEVDVLMLIGGDGAGGVFDGDPFEDLGIGAGFRE